MTSGRGILVVGANPEGLQAALTLAKMGRQVVLVEKDREIRRPPARWSHQGKRWHQYLLTRCLYHPHIEVFPETEILDLEEEESGIRVLWRQNPQWVLAGACVNCQKCLPSCPVELPDGVKPLFPLTAPSSMAIDKRKEAPCRQACPIQMNPQGYVALIAQKRWDEAYDLIRETNPLPGVCGRICHHPCEEACRRQEVDEPVAICALKRFAADQARRGSRRGDDPIPSTPKGPRVAIIGSGPAGLTAAHDLAKAGLRPTILEAGDKPGGLMVQAIAPFRLPREVLQEEIDQILAAGIDLRLNRSIGGLKDLQELEAEEFEAILLATGASRDLSLHIEGEDLESVHGCVSFLKGLWNGPGYESLGRVVVIGGGNAAIEAARSALRAGAEAVSLVCLEKRAEMPAWEFEIQEALQEGVKIINGLGPRRFLQRGGRLSAIEFKECTAVFDQQGAFSPRYDETSLTTLEAETAIVAIGQAAALPFVQREGAPSAGPGGGGEASDPERIRIFRDGTTDIPGVYAAGDLLSGPSTLVQAMASGRKAARMIIHALGLEGETLQENELDAPRGDYLPIPDGIARESRRSPSHREAAERIRDNREVVGPFSVPEAQAEASRCLQCGLCSECLRCQDACELEAIMHDRASSRVARLFDRVVVADEVQVKAKGVSPRLLTRPPLGRTHSWARAMLAGCAVSAEAISGSGVIPPQTVQRVSLGDQGPGIGVFICSCNGTLNPNNHLEGIRAALEGLPRVAHVEVLRSACHPEWGLRIEERIGEMKFNGALIASCACCHLDFVCESCDDQRIRLKDRLFRKTGYDPRDIVLVNIKETCLLPFQDDPEQGMHLAIGMIRAGLAQFGEQEALSLKRQEPLPKALVLGATEAGVAAARALKAHLPSVVLVDEQGVDHKTRVTLQQDGIHLICPARPMRLLGQRGHFTLLLEENSPSQDRPYQEVRAGIIMLGDDRFRDLPYERDPFSKDLQRGMVKAFGALQTHIPGVYMASWSQVRKVPGEILGKAAALEALEGLPGKEDPFDEFVARVDPQLCRGCGTCAHLCPEGAAHLQERARGVASSWVDPGACTRCGNCLAACPTGALTLPESGQDYFEKVIDGFFA